MCYFKTGDRFDLFTHAGFSVIQSVMLPCTIAYGPCIMCISATETFTNATAVKVLSVSKANIANESPQLSWSLITS